MTLGERIAKIAEQINNMSNKIRGTKSGKHK